MAANLMTLKRLSNGEIHFGNPRWTEEGTITCIVEDDVHGILEFHATPYDEESHGVELFEMLSTKYSDQVQ